MTDQSRREFIGAACAAPVAAALPSPTASETAMQHLMDNPDWPVPSFRADDWARAFCHIAKHQFGLEIDEGWMLAWFAAALMRGHLAGWDNCYDVMKEKL